MGLDAEALDKLLGATRAEVMAAGRAAAGEQAAVLELLNKWLDARKDGERPLAVAFELLAGMGEATKLVWHHALYWGMTVRAWTATASSEMVEVLARAFDMTGPNEYGLANVRRLFRRIYERGAHAELSEAARKAIAASGVQWELVPLRDVDEAMEVLIALAVTESQEGGKAGACKNVWEHVEQGTAVAGDVLLGAFIAAHPGELERRVIEKAEKLAKKQGGVGKTVLSHVLESGFEQPPRWARTHAAWDAALGLQLFEKAQREGLLDQTTQHNSFHVAGMWSARAPARVDGLSPEMRDVLRSLGDQSPLPLIVPEDASGLDAAEIEQMFARYCGVSLDDVYGRFHAGFIAKGERLGELIARDAATLRALGVSRFALADRLLDVIGAAGFNDEQWHPVGGVEVTAMSFMGHKHDPFHVYDVYGLIGHLGAKDFAIRRGDLEIRGGDLQIALIRRACFFGGPGCYRLDPEITARVLGLIG